MQKNKLKEDNGVQNKTKKSEAPPKMSDLKLKNLFYKCDLRVGEVEDCYP